MSQELKRMLIDQLTSIEEWISEFKEKIDSGEYQDSRLIVGCHTITNSANECSRIAQLYRESFIKK